MVTVVCRCEPHLWIRSESTIAPVIGNNKLCGRPPQYARHASYKLTFDLLTLKVVSESSRVMWATSVPVLVFLVLSVLDLGPMYATDRRQTERQTSDAHHRLMPPPCGGGGIIIAKRASIPAKPYSHRRHNARNSSA